MYDDRDRHTFADLPTPSPTLAWTITMSSPCTRHHRPAGEPCWTGVVVGCCGTRVATIGRRT